MFRALASWILVSVCLTGAAQNDRTFPNDWASWYIEVTQPGQWPEFEVTYHFIDYIHQPQIELDGRSWGRLYVSTGEEDPFGLVAVDSGRVIFRSLNPYSWWSVFSYFDTTARVLYDFDLAIGDTAYQQLGPITVNSEDTLQLWGQSRRHLVLSNGDEWVEGIGSVHGLFYPLAPTWGLEVIGYDMTSFCGHYIDPDSLPYQMCLPDAFDEHHGPAVNIAPNPCRGEFYIRTRQHGGTFSVHDVHGAIIHQDRLRGTETRVDLTHVPAGLYVVKAQNTWTKLIIE